MSVIIYIAVMAGVTYLIRMIPFTLFRKKIKSTFFRSFLYYIPYAVLSAMTIPAIFYSTGNITTSIIGTVVAVILAYLKLPLIVVALAASASLFVRRGYTRQPLACRLFLFASASHTRHTLQHIHKYICTGCVLLPTVILTFALCYAFSRPYT